MEKKEIILFLRPSLFRDVTWLSLVVGRFFWDCLTLEYGTDRLSRNVPDQLPTYTA